MTTKTKEDLKQLLATNGLRGVEKFSITVEDEQTQIGIVSVTIEKEGTFRWTFGKVVTLHRFDRMAIKAHNVCSKLMEIVTDNLLDFIKVSENNVPGLNVVLS